MGAAERDVQWNGVQRARVLKGAPDKLWALLDVISAAYVCILRKMICVVRVQRIVKHGNW